MADAAFLSEIEKEASRKEEVIRRESETERGRILEEARKEAARMEASAKHRTDLEIRKHQNRLVTQKDLERRREFLLLKSRFIKEAVATARLEFDALSSEKEYAGILKKFLSELVQSLDGSGTKKKTTLRVRPEDEKIARDLVKDLRLSADIRTDTGLSRGIELEEETGGIRLRNTFDSRLQKAHEEILKRLNELLFEKIDV